MLWLCMSKIPEVEGAGRQQNHKIYDSVGSLSLKQITSQNTGSLYFFFNATTLSEERRLRLPLSAGFMHCPGHPQPVCLMTSSPHYQVTSIEFGIQMKEFIFTFFSNSDSCLISSLMIDLPDWKKKTTLFETNFLKAFCHSSLHHSCDKDLYPLLEIPFSCSFKSGCV